MAPSTKLHMTCPRCGSDALGPQSDSVSGAPVAADGKVMLRCRACNEVLIVPEAQMDRALGRAPRREHFRIAVAATGAFVCLALAAIDWLTGFGVPWPAGLGFGVAFGVLGAFEIVFQRVWLLRRHGLIGSEAMEKLAALGVYLLVLALLGFLLWLALPDLRRSA